MEIAVKLNDQKEYLVMNQLVGKEMICLMKPFDLVRKHQMSILIVREFANSYEKMEMEKAIEVSSDSQLYSILDSISNKNYGICLVPSTIPGQLSIFFIKEGHGDIIIQQSENWHMQIKNIKINLILTTCAESLSEILPLKEMLFNSPEFEHTFYCNDIEILEYNYMMKILDRPIKSLLSENPMILKSSLMVFYGGVACFYFKNHIEGSVEIIHKIIESERLKAFKRIFRRLRSQLWKRKNAKISRSYINASDSSPCKFISFKIVGPPNDILREMLKILIVDLKFELYFSLHVREDMENLFSGYISCNSLIIANSLSNHFKKISREWKENINRNIFNNLMIRSSNCSKIYAFIKSCHIDSSYYYIPERFFSFKNLRKHFKNSNITAIILTHNDLFKPIFELSHHRIVEIDEIESIIIDWQDLNYSDSLYFSIDKTGTKLNFYQLNYTSKGGKKFKIFSSEDDTNTENWILISSDNLSKKVIHLSRLESVDYMFAIVLFLDGEKFLKKYSEYEKNNTIAYCMEFKIDDLRIVFFKVRNKYDFQFNF